MSGMYSGWVPIVTKHGHPAGEIQVIAKFYPSAPMMGAPGMGMGMGMGYQQ